MLRPLSKLFKLTFLSLFCIKLAMKLLVRIKNSCFLNLFLNKTL